MKIEKNVREFTNKCSEEIAERKKDEFEQEIWNTFLEKKIESPIEQILYCALKTIQMLNYIDEEEIVLFNKTSHILGLNIISQARIGKYRCDFLISFMPVTSKPNSRVLKMCLERFKQLIVECDSQQFHERTEKERRYEKARDRYFSKQGYKVFHYTGSEIIKRSLEIAIEILAYVTGKDEGDFLEDSNCE